jgi:RNA polymerase sigma-70 factor (ECF subfamily)
LQASKVDEPDAFVHFAEFQRFANQEIDALPGIQGEIFKMSRLEGLNNEEIARKLDISKRTVEHQIYRALKKLKKNLVTYYHLILVALSWF